MMEELVMKKSKVIMVQMTVPQQKQSQMNIGIKIIPLKTKRAM